jgi:hypothetical protein
MTKIITTKEINKILNQGIITPEILGYAAYSVNKRAKNWRDKETEYRNKRKWNHFWFDKYDNEFKAKEQKQKYYNIKQTICEMFEPTKIHSLKQWRWNRNKYEDELVTIYFLCYEIGGFFFHQPINDIKDINLPIEKLDDNFETFGDNITNLMSMQMVKKILNGLNEGLYQIKFENN